MLLYHRWAAESSASPCNPAYTAEGGRCTSQLAQEVDSGHNESSISQHVQEAPRTSGCRKHLCSSWGTLRLLNHHLEEPEPTLMLSITTCCCCAYLDEVHADKPEEVAMPGELLKILCQGDPLLLGNGVFLNVQPKGRREKKNAAVNCTSFPCRDVSSQLPSQPSLDQMKTAEFTMFAYCQQKATGSPTNVCLPNPKFLFLPIKHSPKSHSTIHMHVFQIPVVSSPGRSH